MQKKEVHMEKIKYWSCYICDIYRASKWRYPEELPRLQIQIWESEKKAEESSIVETNTVEV